MKKILSIILFLCLASTSYGAFGTWTFSGLTGGGSALDGRSVVSIEDADLAMGLDGANGLKIYLYSAASSAAESSPDVIVPNDAGPSGRWLLIRGAAEYVQMTPSVAPAYSEALFYYDSTTKTFSIYNDEADVVLSVGEEMFIRVYNDSGADIQNGQVCYLSGVFGSTPTIALAQSNAASTCLATIGLSTHVIENGTTGYITSVGLVHDLNTVGYTAGDRLYLSATTPGGLVNTPPESPNYLIGMGQAITIDGATGTIQTNVSIGTNTSSVIKIFNGSVLEDTTTTVTSNGVDTVTLSYEQSGGGDLSLFFDAGFTLFDSTPAATVSLSIGSDIAPTLNYVYIPQSTGVLTSSTVGFPASAEHVPVASVIVQSAASAATDGVYKMHAWTDHLSNGGDQGHLSHVNNWIRAQHATWNSGAIPTTTIVPSGVALDAVDFAVTAGEILQLHDHDFPAINTATTGHIYAVNDSVTAYKRITDLNAIDKDSTGGTLRTNNTYYSFVIWGSVSEDAGDSQLFLNLPSGSYISALDAQNDINKYSNYAIPNGYKGTGFLIARVTLRYQTIASGTITEIETEDLRGLVPSTAAGGGGTAVGTEFSDNLFKIQNVADVTKEISFDASAITTANTRTISMADQAINLTPDTTFQSYDVNTSKVNANETVSGNRTYTGAIDSTGASSNASGPLVFTSTVTPPAADGKITYLSGVTGWTHKIFSFFTTTVQYILSYDTLPTVDGSVPTYNATNDDIDWTVPSGTNADAIEFVIDGGGSAITTGVKGYIEIPYDCTINSVTMLADQSGSAVVDIWVDTYANYPPLDADSITASAVPTITTALKSQDATLTGWTTSLTKGSVIGFNVDSATTITFLTISLKVDK